MTTATLPAVTPSNAAPSRILTAPPPVIPGGNYKASRNSDGTWNAYNIPIMGEFKKGEHDSPIDILADWHQACVDTAQQRFKEGKFLHPLHIRHSTDRRGKIAAGFFLPKFVAPLTYEGKTMSFVFADYIAIPDDVFAEMRAGRLPYRSIESFNVYTKQINELALMADDEPYFKLPMHTFEIVEGVEASALNVYDTKSIRLAQMDEAASLYVERLGGRTIFCYGASPEKLAGEALAKLFAQYAPPPAKKKAAKKPGAAKPSKPGAPPVPGADPNADPNADPSAEASENEEEDPEEDPEADPEGGGSEMLQLLRAIYARVCAPEMAKAKNPAPAEQPPAPAGTQPEAQKRTALLSANPNKEETVSDPTKEKANILELARADAKANASADETETMKEEKAIEALAEAGLAELKAWNVGKSTLESLKKWARMGGKDAVDAYVADYKATRPMKAPKGENGLTAAGALAAGGAPAPAAGAAPATTVNPQGAPVNPNDPLGKYQVQGGRVLEAARVFSRQFDEVAKFMPGVSREEFIDGALEREGLVAAKK